MKNVRHRYTFRKISDLDSKGRSRSAQMEGRAGVCVHPQRIWRAARSVPERDQLAGIAKGAKPENYRDRRDRF
jgi:hypothetical protein